MVASKEKLAELLRTRLFRANNFLGIIDLGVIGFRAARLWKEKLDGLSEEERFLRRLEILLGIDTRVPRFTPIEAAQAFKFDVGHYPIDGAVYTRHPLKDDFYLPPSTVNVRLAREKLFAFSHLAAALGAKQIRLESGVVKSKKWTGKIAMPLPQAAAQLGLNAAFNGENIDSAKIFASYDKPTQRPFVPKEVEPWVDSDSSFASMVRERFDARLRNQRVSIDFEESYNFNVGAVGTLGNIGFEVGGKFESIVHSMWNYEIEYWSIS